MPSKRRKPQEIFAKLRQVDVMMAQDHSVADAMWSIGASDVTYHRARAATFETWVLHFDRTLHNLRIVKDSDQPPARGH